MSHARQQYVKMRLGVCDKSFLHIGDPPPQPVNRLADVETQVGRHLVVARPGRVQLPGHRTKAGGQQCLDRHVDVLGAGVQGGGPRMEVSGEYFQPVRDDLCVFSSNYSAFPQHFHMRDAALDVIGPQALVEGERSIELVYECVGVLGEAPGPEFRC